MNIQQVMAELGRLHMENIALRSENDQLKGILAASALAGPSAASLDPNEAATVDPRASGDDPDGQTGEPE